MTYVAPIQACTLFNAALSLLTNGIAKDVNAEVSPQKLAKFPKLSKFNPDRQNARHLKLFRPPGKWIVQYLPKSNKPCLWYNHIA